MSIVSIFLDTAAQIGQNPRIVKVISTDNLATVTAAGYLNPTVQLEAGALLPTDEIHMWYGYTSATSPGTFAVFTAAISNGIITLSLNANPGDVLLPVVSGDFANFNGTTGQINDAGYSPTNAAKTKVVMLNAAPTINHVAIFTAADGTIGDGGVLGTAAAKAASDNTKATVASITAATTIGQLAQFNDITGTIGNSGVLTSAVQLSANIKAGSVAWAGGGTSNAFAIAGLTTSSIVIPAIQAQTTGTVYIERYTVTANTLTVTFSADPGAMVLQYTAFIAPQ